MQPDKVIIFDTTLRDGEQCPGASMNIKEKLEIARQIGNAVPPLFAQRIAEATRQVID